MKKDDGLGKLYHLFTGEERFRLQLEALIGVTRPN
jgi:hypothetical protein